MNILIIYDKKLPALKYGGTERVIWYLGQELARLGHKVTYLVPRGSYCPFAGIRHLNKSLPVHLRVPEDTDIVHFHYQPDAEPELPYLITIHGNLPVATRFFRNTNFVSKNHAGRYGSDAWIYNGLNWDDYGKPEFSKTKGYVHFLGKAAWRVKNVKGAIVIAHRNRTEIKVLGGSRINLKMGLRITWSRWATFYGMVGGEEKLALLRQSRALIFPVLWHEPFGLAIIESLFFGCPVLGTRYGSLPELVPSDTGFLSNSMDELAEAFIYLETFNRHHCHEYACDLFNSAVMAKGYAGFYEQILNGKTINSNPFASAGKKNQG